LKLVSGGPKYIAVRKKLNRDDAQKHCSEKYQNGSLCSLKDNADLNNLTALRKGERGKEKYWTGLMRRNYCFEFSDGTSASYAKTKFNLESSESERCYYIVENKENLDKEECTKAMYFICQVNKGNIYIYYTCR
jgi:hypothetical protein